MNLPRKLAQRSSHGCLRGAAWVAQAPPPSPVGLFLCPSFKPGWPRKTAAAVGGCPPPGRSAAAPPRRRRPLRRRAAEGTQEAGLCPLAVHLGEGGHTPQPMRRPSWWRSCCSPAPPGGCFQGLAVGRGWLVGDGQLPTGPTRHTSVHRGGWNGVEAGWNRVETFGQLQHMEGVANFPTTFGFFPGNSI